MGALRRRGDGTGLRTHWAVHRTIGRWWHGPAGLAELLPYRPGGGGQNGGPLGSAEGQSSGAGVTVSAGPLAQPLRI